MVGPELTLREEACHGVCAPRSVRPRGRRSEVAIAIAHLFGRTGNLANRYFPTYYRLHVDGKLRSARALPFMAVCWMSHM